MKFYTFYIILLMFSLTSCGESSENSEKALVLETHVEQLDTKAKKAVTHWDGYIALEKDLAIITNTNPLNAIELMDKLANNCNAMVLEIPDSIETPAIRKQVKRVDTKINEFYAEVNRNEIREGFVQNHIDTIISAFDKLNKELNSSL